MATRDYVKQKPKARSSKGTSPRGNAKKGQAKKNSVDVGPSWFKILISLAVVCLFVYGLYQLSGIGQASNDTDAQELENAQSQEALSAESSNSDNDPDNTPNNNNMQQNPDEVLEKAIVEPLKPLPVLAEEEWEYIDSLPEFEVEVDATGPLESDRDFVMQCGSFRTTDRAEELRAKIALQGLEARVLSSDGSNGRWYRVVLGPYEKKRNAERHRHQLRKVSVNRCIIF